MMILTKNYGALFKAKSKVGLVAVKKTVKGKKGTFTRTYWMKPEDAEKVKGKKTVLKGDNLEFANKIIKKGYLNTKDYFYLMHNFSQQEKHVFIERVIGTDILDKTGTSRGIDDLLAYRKFHLIHRAGYVFKDKESFQNFNTINKINIFDYLSPYGLQSYSAVDEFNFIPEDKIFEYFNVDNSEKAAEIEQILSKANFKKKSLDDKVTNVLLNNQTSKEFTKKDADSAFKFFKLIRQNSEKLFRDSNYDIDEYRNSLDTEDEDRFYYFLGDKGAGFKADRINEWYEDIVFRDLDKKWDSKDYDMLRNNLYEEILEYKSNETTIQDLFEQTFDKKEHASIDGNYTVHAVYEFKNKNFDAKKAEKKDHKSKALQFHGTKAKYIQSFIDNGVIVPSEADVGRMLGDGFYTTPVSSKAMQYMDEDGFSRKSGIGVIFISEQYLGKTSKDKLGEGDHDTCSLNKGDEGLKNPENATTFVKGVNITHACVVSLGGNAEHVYNMLLDIRKVYSDKKMFSDLPEHGKKVIQSLYKEMEKSGVMDDRFSLTYKFIKNEAKNEKQKMDMFFSKIIRKK